MGAGDPTLDSRATLRALGSGRFAGRAAILTAADGPAARRARAARTGAADLVGAVVEPAPENVPGKTYTVAIGTSYVETVESVFDRTDVRVLAPATDRVTERSHMCSNAPPERRVSGDTRDTFEHVFEAVGPSP
jgi:hypothetical protein